MRVASSFYIGLCGSICSLVFVIMLLRPSLFLPNSQAQSRVGGVAPEWRSHHIFNGTGDGLHTCPDKWPAQLQVWGPNASRKPGRMLPFTLEALEIVWQHQHPQDCQNATFLVYHVVASGVGSVLHVMTAALRGALDSGRVLLEAPGTFLAPSSYCGPHTTLDSCYFLPLSNCSVTAAEIAAAPMMHGENEYQRLLARDPGLPRIVRIDVKMLGVYFDRPSTLEHLLDKTTIPSGKFSEGSKHRMYWWRAIGVAYIVRPNARTRGELESRRSKLIGGQLETGCIGLFVRHGDKHTENPIFTDHQYEAAVTKLRQIDPSLTRQIFLSTEDGATVAYYRNTSRAWSTSYVDMPMKNDPHISNLAYMSRRGYHEEMLDGLLNLQYILTCDGFVGSIYSNWARLIDELRSTVWCKGDAVYFDVFYQRPGSVDFQF